MEFLVTLHDLWRWVVLLAAVVALVGALGGWLGALSPALAARRAGTFYTVALDVQVLLGLVLWIGGAWWTRPGTFFRFEHPTIMLLALVVAHGGAVLARRAKAPAAAARTVALATALSLVLVIVGIPGVVRGG
jgi:hypothetical protein